MAFPSKPALYNAECSSRRAGLLIIRSVFRGKKSTKGASAGLLY